MIAKGYSGDRTRGRTEDPLIDGYPGLLRPMSHSPDEPILASVARTVLSKPGRRPVKAQTLKVG